MEHLSVEVARLLLRGQYDATATAKWEAHLDQCAQCRTLVAQERSWVRMLNLAEAPSAPAGGAERLVERLTEIDALAPQRVRVWPVFAAAGVVAIVAAAAIVMVRRVDGGISTAESARELGVSEAVQRRLIEHAAALEVLRVDPWLADEYEVLRTLADQIVRAGDVPAGNVTPREPRENDGASASKAQGEGS